MKLSTRIPLLCCSTLLGIVCLEQSSGIGQINHSIVEMDNMAQQNSALVEQASAAAQAMNDQAAGLAQIVSVFKLRGV